MLYSDGRERTNPLAVGTSKENYEVEESKVDAAVAASKAADQAESFMAMLGCGFAAGSDGLVTILGKQGSGGNVCEVV